MHLILIHLGIDVISSYLSKISNGDRLSSDTAHLDGVPQSELMVDATLLEILHVVVNYTQVDMCQEFTGNICDLLMLHVVLNCIVIILRVKFSELHVVHSNTVVG